MTEESPLRDKEDYEFPEYHFKKLESYKEIHKVNSPLYNIVKGDLYDELRKDGRVSNGEAVEVSRMLNNGQVEQARETVNEMLEPGEE